MCSAYYLCYKVDGSISSAEVEEGDGLGDLDGDDSIARGVLLRPYEHDKRMLVRMQQAGGMSKVSAVSCPSCTRHLIAAYHPDCAVLGRVL